jgi:Na+/proline symporter
MLITSLSHIICLADRGETRLSRSVASVRFVSVLIGIIVGIVLAYAYQVNLETLPDKLNVTSLVVFASIPLLAGFLVGLLDPEKGVKDGLLVGLITGVFNSVVATVKFIFTSTLTANEVFAFSLFAVMSVFIWVVLAGASAELATRVYD